MTTLAEHAALTADMAPHAATLTRLASRALEAAELGVRTGVSTWALLDGLPADGRLVSVDSGPCSVPQRVEDDWRWVFVAGDSLTIEPVLRSPVDLMLIDSSHEYHQTLAELEMADRVGTRTVLLHDWALPDVRDAARGFLERSGRYRLALLEPSQWGLAGLERLP